MSKDFYKNAKIYKIVDNTNGNIYIGSTCKKLCQRLGQHVSSFKQYLSNKEYIKPYLTSFEILKNGNYQIVLIEEYKTCENIEQLRKKEREYIDNIECVNLMKQGSMYFHIDDSERKRWDLKKNKCNEVKKYLDANKDILLDQIKNAKNVNIVETDDEITSYNKDYYNANKHRLLSKIKCDCGGEYSMSSKSNHVKTQKHLKGLENKKYID